jgi:hypothetical protein
MNTLNSLSNKSGAKHVGLIFWVVGVRGLCFRYQSMTPESHL